MIKKLKDDKIVKVVLLLTIKNANKNFIIELHEKLSIAPYYIDKLPSENEFIRILNKKMIIRNSDESIIKDLYDYCEGNPQNLKIFLFDLISANESKYLKAKTNIQMEDIAKQIAKKRLGKNIQFNAFESIIVLVCWSLGYPKTKDIIIDYALSINNNKKYLEEAFDNLVNKNILDVADYNYPFTYKFSHDSIFYLVENHIKEDENISKIMPQWCNTLMKKIEDATEKKEIDKIESLEVQAKLSQYIQRPPVLKKVNIKYAKYLIKKNRLSEASVILSRLNNINEFLNVKEMIFAMDTLYCSGEYQKLINISKGREFDSFDYYFLKSKAYSILGEKTLSLGCIEKAYQYSKNRDETLLLLNVKLCALLEIEGGRSDAVAQFNNYFKSIEKLSESDFTLGDGYVLKNSEDFLPSEPALKYLEISLQIMIKNNQKYMVDCIKHNMGVILFRIGEYDKATTLFEETSNSLLNYKPHERSYSLNNLAILLMIKKEFKKASDMLEEGLFWNYSPYTKTALMCNLAICKAELGFLKNALGLLEEIENHIKKYNLIYPDIIRKVTMNFAYIYFLCGDVEKSKRCIMNVKDKVLGTTSEYKLNKLIEKIPEMKGYLKKLPEPNLIYEKISFDCWIVTLTHD